MTEGRYEYLLHDQAERQALTMDEWSEFLYERGARRLGYASYAAQCAESQDAVSRSRASKRAVLRAWGRTQLSGN